MSSSLLYICTKFLKEIKKNTLKKNRKIFILLSYGCSLYELLLIDTGYERWMRQDATQETQFGRGDELVQKLYKIKAEWIKLLLKN